jgi:hypothetical protein
MWINWQHGLTAEVSPLLRRRITFTAGLVVASAIVWALNVVLQISLRESAMYSGFLLLVVVLGLTFFNARKKLAFLPLIRASTWLQIHIYAGYFCFFVFLLHIRFSPPRGALEIVLAAIFCVVVFSGFFGIFISRFLPSRLLLSGEPLIYERIPAYRREIQTNVEALIRKAETETQSSTLSDFYLGELRPFFQRLPGAFDALGGIDRRVNRLLKQLTALNRYLDDAEKAIAAEMRDWIETTQNVHFQYAAQRLLKLWLYVHIPFTYSLILLAFVHAALAIIYAGRL